MKLETSRLNLLALDVNNLKLAMDNYSEMQKSLGLKVNNETLDDDIKYAMNVRLRKVLEDEVNYLWLTNWAITLRDENIVIGYIMIKGLPNLDGEVITGYGIEENYRNKGYASEALKEMVNWIFKNPKALSIIADTEKENISSHKVLKNAGALKYKETDELIWWKIEK